MLPGKATSRPPVLALQDLSEDGFILVRRPGAPGLYANLLQLCREQGFEPKITAEVPRMMTNLNLVAAGAGISVVPASMRDTHRHAIVYCPLAGGEKLDAPMTLVYRAGELHGPLKKFVTLARKVAALHAPTIEAAPP